MCALLNEIDLLETGRPDTALAEVQADFRHPEVDLERDSWLVFDDGRLIAYGLCGTSPAANGSTWTTSCCPTGPEPPGTSSI